MTPTAAARTATATATATAPAPAVTALRGPGLVGRYLRGAGIPELTALVVAVGALVGFLWFFLTNFSVTGVVLDEVERAAKTLWGWVADAAGWVSDAAGWVGSGVRAGWDWITGD